MAKNNARNITPATKQRLFSLSGGQCAFPECTVMFHNLEDNTNVSNICHIEAAEKGGQRYNPDSNDEYRRSFDNLIMLCPNHHKITDNIEVYTVEVLKKMKRDHEVKVRQQLAGKNITSKYPSALNTMVSKIGSQLFFETISEESLTAPAPEEKIAYNNISEYKPIIDTYKVYQGKLNKIYQEIEKQGSTRKEFVLKNINTIYLREKGKYVDFEEIKMNADTILRNVETELWSIVENSSNRDETMHIEAIQMSLLIIMVDAFMRCEILEEPPGK